MAGQGKVDSVDRLNLSSEGFSEHSVERKDEKNEDSNRESEDSCSSNEAEKIEWSTALKSPSSAVFSPCNAVVSGTKEPQHGSALLALVERARTVTTLYRRATVLLLKVARAYDEFSQSLLKAGQCLKEIGIEASDLQQSLVFWSGSISKLANSFRTEICAPMKSLLQAYTDSLHGIREKYSASRQTCVLVRQSTERVATSYNEALQATEQAAVEWIANGKEEGTLHGSLKSICQNLQQKKSRYTKFVDWEKTCIDQCADMEKIALESLQLLEDHRMHFTTSVLTLGVQSLRQTAHEVIRSVKKDTPDEVTKPEEKRGAAEHVRRRLSSSMSSSNSSAYEEGSGTMDAETLGLPDEIGKLRDTFRTRIADRNAKVQRFRVLIAFVEYICSGLDALSKNLNEILSKNDTNMRSLQELCGGLKDQDATHIVELLGGISSYISVEADAAASCALEVRQLSSTHISDVITYGDKLLTAASNSEELIYKQLCDSARTKSRANELYLLTTDEQTKARERVSSIDHKESETSSTSSINKHVSWHIANMLSALPNGGEHALNMLNPSARASLAQNSLEQADEKESKSRQVLDSASKEMNRLCSKYCHNAERLCAQFDKEDDGGWGDLTVVTGHLRSLIISSREKMLDTSPVTVSERTSQLCINAMNRRVLYYRAEYLDSCQNHSDDEPRNAIDHASPTLSDFLQDFAISEPSKIGDEDLFIEEGDTEFEPSMEGSSSKDDYFLDGDTGIRKSQDDEETLLSVANGSGTEGEGQLTKWMGLPLSGSGMLGVQDTIRDKLSFLKKSRRRYRRPVACGSNTDMFLTYFWTEKSDLQTFPDANATYFPCSMSETNNMLDVSYGVVFLSDSTFWFSSWTGKRVSLQMGAEVTQVDLIENSWKCSSDSIRISVQKADGKTARLGLGLNGVLRAQQAYALLKQNVDKAKTKLEASESETAAGESALNNSGGSLSSEVDGIKSTQPDMILSKMEAVLTRRLNRMSVQRFYEIVWEKSLYESFLKETCMDVEVGPWDHAKCHNPVDMELYGQKRSVQYRVKRKTHLYIGPPIAEIKQTQFCRVEDQDKCVMSMTIEFEGIPYSDCFVVEVRWVAHRDNSDGIVVAVGVSQDPLCPAIEEASAVHRNLFEYVRKACIEAGGTEAPCESDVTESSLESIETKPSSPSHPFLRIAGFFFIALLLFRLSRPTPPSELLSTDSTLMLEHIKNLEDRVESMQKSLDEILSLLKKSD